MATWSTVARARRSAALAVMSDLFDDPALVLRCDVPFGWCVDSESSLFRLVFRPWNRTDERVVATVVPSLASPAASDAQWVEAASSALGLEGAAASDVIASGTALLGRVTAADETFHRIVVRGPALDIVADHLGVVAAANGSPDETLLRFVTAGRAPARSQIARTPSVEEARETIEALPNPLGPGDGVSELRAFERAAENAWVRSLARGDLAEADVAALRAVLEARLAFATSSLLSLRRAHAVLLRAQPGGPPSGPVLEEHAALQERLASALTGAFTEVARILRSLPGTEQWADVDDETFGSDAFVQLALSHLIVEEARNRLAQNGPVVPAAVREALDARLAALGMLWPKLQARGETSELLPDIALLGRAVTTYADAALPMDLRIEVLEASAFLTSVGHLFVEDGASNPEAALEVRRLGAIGLIQQADVLIRTADAPSLQAALERLEQAHAELDQAEIDGVDRLNALHDEALAAAQLGVIERARQAVERGMGLAGKADDWHQLEFFHFMGELLEANAVEPGVQRSIPELQLAFAAKVGEPRVLDSVCATLHAALERNPLGLPTIEMLAVAARLVEELDADLTRALLSATESLLDVQRLRLASSSELRGGADDALLARNVLADTVEELIGSGRLGDAAAAADRARARSLLLDLNLWARDRAGFGDAIASADTGLGPIIDALHSEAWLSALRPPPLPANPFGTPNWLRLLVRRLEPALAEFISRFDPRPLTPEGLLETVHELGHPALLLHPTDESIALLLVMPDGEIHAGWSPVPTGQVLVHLDALRDELPVWVSSRGKNWFARRNGDSAEEEAGSSTVLRAAAADAYRSLIEPVSEHLIGANALTIVPYRELGAVPYALLEDDKGSPLIERLALSVVPSVATLAAIRGRKPRMNGAGAYVVGDPATDLAFALDRLPAAAREAKAVRRRLTQVHPRTAVVYRGAGKATVASYRDEARDTRLVHLSCHAYVGSDATSSRLFLAPGPDDDGTLDLNEIATVPLTDALVILAACRSGSGRATADGTVGLAREFLRAGAAAVVAAYWNVSDEATARLVDHFYESFIGGSVTVAAALQQAMLATREDLHLRRIRLPKAEQEREHPVYWGPFFVLGDGSKVDDL